MNQLIVARRKSLDPVTSFSFTLFALFQRAPDANPQGPQSIESFGPIIPARWIELRLCHDNIGARMCECGYCSSIAPQHSATRRTNLDVDRPGEVSGEQEALWAFRRASLAGLHVVREKALSEVILARDEPEFVGQIVQPISQGGLSRA